MHSLHGIYRARLLNISTIRLYVGVKRQRHTETRRAPRWGGGRTTGEKRHNLRGRSTRDVKRRSELQEAAEQEGKKRGRERWSGKEGRQREGKWKSQRGGQKRLARPFYFETNAQCSGRSVAQNSVLSVLLPDVAASLRKHSCTLNTSYLRVFILVSFQKAR